MIRGFEKNMTRSIKTDIFEKLSGVRTHTAVPTTAANRARSRHARFGNVLIVLRPCQPLRVYSSKTKYDILLQLQQKLGQGSFWLRLLPVIDFLRIQF